MSLVPGSVTIDLKYPIEVEGATLSQITMRRPKVRDQLTAMKAEGSEVDQELRLFAHLCEQSPQALEDLDLADYQQLQRTFTAFLELTPKP
jgi:hypothetical protein